ncbi:MAG: sigma-70 family RNA polymerase sigma factor [Dysgonomonas sp.]|nr:sigma-70 family RNA polymerase sigma factor [Dysgonomonas sp.]
MDEKQQIRKVLRGDTSAFNYFVETYQNMAVTIAYRICENRQDAEDIVQNAFVKAYHNLHTFRVDSKFSTWFYRIVYNTALTHINTSIFNTDFVDYKQLDSADSYSEWDTLSQIEENERKEIISKAMGLLSKEESLLLSLYYLEDNSVKDISLITGLTDSNVKVKLHRSRKKLADVLSSLMRHETI